MIEVHQDDFHEAASLEDMESFKAELSKRIDLTWSEPILPTRREQAEGYHHLKCQRIRTVDGAWIKGNRRYLQAAVKELGLERAKFSPTPMASTRCVAYLELGPAETYKFRKCGGLLRYYRRYKGQARFT